MTKTIKTAFLILRVDESFKNKLSDKANSVGLSISEFVRRALLKLM